MYVACISTRHKQPSSRFDMFYNKRAVKEEQAISTYDDAVQNFANYFRRTFRKNFGETPLEYLTQLRIANAKQLLTIDSYKSISDVAAQCGFSDSLYFSTCFKKHVGMSPLKYRNLILSNMEKPRK